MGRRRSKEFILRILAITVLSILAVVFLITVLFVNNRLGDKEATYAVQGALSLAGSEVCEQPVYLNGQWDTFEDVVCESSQDVQNLGEAKKQVEFPIGSITQAKKDATYRLRFLLPDGQHESLVVYIPTFYKSADIYMNGVKQSYYQEGSSWMQFSTLESVVSLAGADKDTRWQELVITGSFEQESVTLYKRPIVLGTMKNVAELAIFSSSNEMFLFGLLLLLLIHGYVFMLFRPGHKIISVMTLFDTMILMRSLLSLNHVVAFAKDVFPWFPVSDRVGVSVTIFFLMMGGIVGCVLSSAIYDPENKAPQWLIKPMPWIYGAFAIIFPFSLTFFENYGRYILIIVYGLTFIGVFLQYKVSWTNKEKQVYNLLQFIKTIYIGVLIFVDILLWNTSTNFLRLFYLYSIFFILHVIVRLYDNNESYREVEVLNTGLEDTVRKRTKELSEANQVLAELSVKDPLTQIFNRLYFERAMEQAVANFTSESSLYLCIFDLDFFKRINDTYGHNAGDEQLKYMVALVNAVVQDKHTFARFGGEEFILLFSQSERQAVMDCIQKVHATIADDASRNEQHTTASFGVASFLVGDTPRQLLERADLALYEAKRLGRNCIVTNFEGHYVKIDDESD